MKKYPGNLALFFYALCCYVHWPRRRTELLRHVDEVKRIFDIKRVVDFGCAHGIVAEDILEMDLKYLGLDIDLGAIAYCKERFKDLPQATFLPLCKNEIQTGSISPDNVINSICSEDLLLLNGVVHHLTEHDVQLLKPYFIRSGAIVVLDHYREDAIQNMKAIPKLLQKLDKGKNIRSYSYYADLFGLDAMKKSIFSIHFMGIKLWPYFCHTYSIKKFSKVRSINDMS